MKKTKKFLAVVLCMLLMLTPLAVVAETVTVQAAGPQTVKVKLDKKTGKIRGTDIMGNQGSTSQLKQVLGFKELFSTAVGQIMCKFFPCL